MTTKEGFDDILTCIINDGQKHPVRPDWGYFLASSLIEAKDEINKLRAELDKHRMIPVTERMPGNMVRVLILMTNNYVVCACYSHLRDEWKNDSGSVIRPENVVSWTPLPEPPEVKP